MFTSNQPTERSQDGFASQASHAKPSSAIRGWLGTAGGGSWG
jgi:hypothetical protein